MGIITLALPASAGGADILLATQPPGQAYPVSIPPSVHVNAGYSQVTFNIGTSPTVTPVQVPIQATYGASSKTAILTVAPPGLISVTVTPTVMHVNTTTTTGYVFLNAPAPPGNMVISLAVTAGSTTPSVSILVPAGQTQARFAFTAPSTVPAGGYVTITATDPNGTVKTAKVLIIP